MGKQISKTTKRIPFAPALYRSYTCSCVSRCIQCGFFFHFIPKVINLIQKNIWLFYHLILNLMPNLMNFIQLFLKFIPDYKLLRIALTLSSLGGGQICPPYVIFFDNFLTAVFFDPNSSLVFLKTPKTCFKTHFESKKIFTGRVIWFFCWGVRILKFYFWLFFYFLTKLIHI